ncbi:hypothetical protein BH09PAT2_BH09PAT2_07970 [soil metagenome]
MNKLIKSLRWIDDNILKILVIGFIFIIPLYPKLPLQNVNYTYIAIRVEDIYMGIVCVIFLIQFLRRKVSVPWKMAALFGLFWASVFASYLVGFYVHKTVIINNLGLLHSMRRVEYMMIFFVVYASIKTRRDFLLYMRLVLFVLGIVSVYGIGQKFLGWPAVQTMNPEYAKGYWLVLDAYARVSSTFAGHYDLAAYLIFLIPILLGYYLKSKNYIYFGVFVLALGTVILTASRASYLSYLIAVTCFLLYTRQFKLLLMVFIATAILTPLSSNLTQRLTRTFQQTKIFVDPETGKVIVPKDNRIDNLPVGDFGATVDATKEAKNAKPVVVDKKSATEAKKQIREQIVQNANSSGTLLTEAQINALVESTFGKQIPVTKYLVDISLSTRFQVEWPRAINAFKKDPILGTGPSSITEATDGDYLRWLGETGALGTILFLTIIGTIAFSILKNIKKMTKQYSFLFYGFLFGTLGLFINASYIDVFEASKDAYTFWLVAGIFYASLPLFAKEKASPEKLKID